MSNKTDKTDKADKFARHAQKPIIRSDNTKKNGDVTAWLTGLWDKKLENGQTEDKPGKKKIYRSRGVGQLNFLLLPPKIGVPTS